MRSAAMGRLESNGWIEGRAVQDFSWPYRFEFVSVTDGEFTLISTSGQHRTVPVQKDGTVKIDSVQPGVYTISLQSTTFGVGELRESRYSKFHWVGAPLRMAGLRPVPRFQVEFAMRTENQRPMFGWNSAKSKAGKNFV